MDSFIHIDDGHQQNTTKPWQDINQDQRVIFIVTNVPDPFLKESFHCERVLKNIIEKVRYGKDAFILDQFRFYYS